MSIVSVRKYKVSPLFWYYIFVICTVFPSLIYSQTTQTFSTAGTFTWTAPACITSVNVEVWGGGGGGAGNSTSDDGGGGGGGGGYSKTNSIAVVPGTTYTLVVGAAGTAGAQAANATANGGAGGDSWFIDNTTILARGGSGGIRPIGGARGAAGAGGAVGIGTTTYSGGNGGQGNDDSAGAGGGGGGSAGTGSNGNNGTHSCYSCACGPAGCESGSTAAGGSAVAGGGAGGSGNNGNGSAGSAPGGGGGGGGDGATGAAGGRGKVYLDWTSGSIPAPTMTSANSTTICGGSSVNHTLTSSADPTATFTWIAASNANVLGESTTNQTGSPISDVLDVTSMSDQIVTYSVTASIGTCAGTTQVVSVKVDTGPGDTAVYGNNEWNVYVWNEGGAGGGIPGTGAWVYNYAGNYTIPDSLSFDTRLAQTYSTPESWDETQSPSDASGYSGCTVEDDFHSYVFKRDGFPCGVYEIYTGNDDYGALDINGTVVWTSGGFQDGALAWTGTLGPNSTIVYRISEHGGNSFAKLEFVQTATLTITSSSADMCITDAARALTANDGTSTWSGTGVSGASFDPATAGAGTHTITYTKEGCTATQDITVDPLPTASAGGSQTICVGNDAIVSGASSSNGTILWTEDGAGSITADATTLTPTYTSAAGDAGNTVTLTMTVTSNNACGAATATATYSVVVSAQPTAASGGSQTICVGSTATVSGASSANGTILWTEDGAGSITADATTLTPTYTSAAGDAGNTVTLTMTVSNAPCSDATATYSVVVKAQPTAASGGSQTICVGSTAVVSGASSSNGTILWTEDGAGSITAGATTLTPTYTSAAGDAGNTVTLTMTVSNSPCTDATATYSVVVKAQPTASAGGSQTICQGNTATVSGASSTNGTILWTHNGSGSITADATTLTPTYTSAAGDAGNTVVLTMTVSNPPCTDATATYSVVVNAGPTASAGGSQTICVGSVATVSGATSANGTILWTEDGAGSITAGATTLTPDYTSAAGDAGNTVTLTMSVSDGICPDATATYSVVVEAQPTSSAGGSQTICNGSTATVSGATSSNGTILWTEDGAGSITANATTLTPTYTSVLADAGNVVTLTMTVSNSPCVAATATYSVLVNPDASINLTSAVGTDSQSVCLNTAITDIEYTVNNVVTNVTATGLPAGVTTNFNAGTGVFTISGTPSVSGVYAYTVTTTGSCVQTDTTGSIRVGISLSSTVGTDTQSVCKNTAITAITYAIGGSGASAIASGLPPGVSGSLTSPGVFTISGTASVEGTYNYTVTTTAPCAATSLTGVITVGLGLPDDTTNIQNVCKNTAINDIDYDVVGGGTPTTTGLPAGLVTNFNAGTNVFTISGSPSVEGTYNYTVTTTGSCTDQSSLTGTITVGLGLPDDTTNIQNVCKNTAILDIDYDVVGGGTPTTTGLPQGLTTNFNAGTNVFTISGTPSVEGTYNYTVTTTGSCTEQSSLTGTITVGLGLPDDTTNIQNVCKNTAILDIDYDVVGGGTPLTSGLPQGLTTNFNAGTNVFTISGTPSVEGTYDYTVTTTGSCTEQSSLTGTITVGLGLPDDTTNIQSVCKNTAIIDIDYDVVGGAAPTTTGLPAGLSTNFNAGTNVFTISGTPSVEGTYDYTVTTTGSCADQSSLTGTITVGLGLPDDTTNIQSVCKNTAILDIDYDVVGGAAPTVTGLPQGLTTNFNAGTNVFTISGTPSVEGTYNYTVTTTGSCTDQSSLTGTITVGLGLPDDTTNIQNVCKNTAITDIDYDVVGGAAPTTSGLPAGLTTNFNAGTNVFTISGTPSVEGTYDYTVTTTGSCTDQSSLTGTITVGLGLPDDTTNIQNVCKNTAIIDIDYDVVGGAAPSTTGLPAGLTTNFNSLTNVFTISGTPSVEGTYDYTVTTTGSCTEQSSLTGTITVGIGLATPGTDTQSVCRSSPIVDIVYNVVGGGTPTVTGLPAGVAGILTSPTVFTIGGTPSVEGTFNYTVTTTGSCTDQSTLTGQITVGMSSPLSNNNIQNVCKNVAIADIVYTFVGGGTPTVVSLPPGVSGSVSNPGEFTISGTPSVEGIYTYTLTTTGSCSAQSTFTGTITVGGGLDTTGGSNVQYICKNSAITPILYNIVGGSATVGGLPNGITGTMTTAGSPGVFTISGTASVEGIFNYTVTTNGSCATESSFTGTITVGGGLDPTGGSNVQNICKNSAITPILYNIIGGSATVSGLPNGITGAMTTAGSPGVFTISGTSSVEGIFNYTVTTVGTCTTESSFTGTITVGGGLDPSGGSNVQNICKNTAITPILYNIIGGSATASGLPNGITGAMTTAGSPGVFTISGTASVEGIYNYTVTTVGTCTTESSFTGTITVGGGLDPTGGSNVQDICKNSAITPIKYNIIGGSATVSGLPNGITGAMTTAGSPGVFTISGTASVEGIFTYTVTTVGTCTTESSFTGTITVGGGLIVLGGSNIQTICRNAAITPIQYKIIGTSASVTGLPGGVTGSMTTAGSPGVFTISGTPSVAGVFAYTLTTVSTCTTESSFTGTLTVDEATATLSVPGTDAQTLCSNNTITDIVYNIGGTGTSATVSALPAGLTSSYNNGVFTISGTPNLAEGIHTFTVTPTGGSCPPDPEIFTITIINPVAEFTADPELGSPPLIVNLTNTSQNANTYSWSFGDGVTSSAFDTSYTYTSKGVYTVQLIASNNNQCPDTATTTITVYKIVIPNVFTPNGDNINDVFAIEDTGVKTIDVEIYNRWGTKIYEWHIPGGNWDGINNITGIPSEDGTYYYIIKITDVNGKIYDETGFVTLIR